MWVDALGVFAVACVIVAFSLTRMIPLRIFGMLSNTVTISYGVLTHNPILVVEGIILFPLNGWRLVQMVTLVKKAEKASRMDLSMDWLRPYGHVISYEAGDIVFRKNDEAHDMFCIERGRFMLIELGIELKPGAIVGEMGLLAPEQRRTQGLKCVESGAMLRVSYQHLMQLYYQNPKFGFYLLRLVSQRLMENANKAQARQN